MADTFPDSKEIRKQIFDRSFERLKEVLSNLSSLYSSNIPSTNYALWFRGAVEEVTKLLISGDILTEDGDFDETRIDYLFQILGQRLHKVEPEFVPNVRSDKEYQTFVLSLLRAILLGAKLIALREGIKIFVQNATVVELYKVSDDISKEFKWYIDLNGNVDNLDLAWAGLKFWTELMKPAHTLSDVRIIWEENYKGKLQDSLAKVIFENYVIEDLRKNLDAIKVDTYIEEDLSYMLKKGAVRTIVVNKRPIVKGDGNGIPNWEMVGITVEIDGVPKTIDYVNPFEGIVRLDADYVGTSLVVKHYWIDRPLYAYVFDIKNMISDGNERDFYTSRMDENSFSYIGVLGEIQIKPQRIIRPENIFSYDYKGLEKAYTTMMDELTFFADIYRTVRGRFDDAHIINSLGKTEGMESWGPPGPNSKSVSTQVLREGIPLVVWTQDMMNEFNGIFFHRRAEFVESLSSLFASLLAVFEETFVLGNGQVVDLRHYSQRLYSQLFENTTKTPVQTGDGKLGTIKSDSLVGVKMGFTEPYEKLNDWFPRGLIFDGNEVIIGVDVMGEFVQGMEMGEFGIYMGVIDVLLGGTEVKEYSRVADVNKTRGTFDDKNYLADIKVFSDWTMSVRHQENYSMKWDKLQAVIP